MAETNFDFFGNTAGDVRRGVTAAFTKPNGGENFVFGFHSQASATVATGFYALGTNFNPLRDDSGNPTGCSIRAALKRAPSPNVSGYSIAIFGCLQGASAPTENDYGYMLGLSSSDPNVIALAKCAPIAGLDADASTTLRTSTETFTWDTWVHLRLDIIVNPNGDVVLKASQNNLDITAVTTPYWEAIDGMEDYIDDALAINTGSNPMAGGWGGVCFQSENANSRALVDHFDIRRQK